MAKNKTLLMCQALISQPRHHWLKLAWKKEGSLWTKGKWLKLWPEYWLVLFHLWCCRLACTEEGTVASLPTKREKTKASKDRDITPTNKQTNFKKTMVPLPPCWAPPLQYFYNNLFEVIIGLLLFCTHFCAFCFDAHVHYLWLLNMGAVSP